MSEVLIESELYSPTLLFLGMRFRQALSRRTGSSPPAIVSEIVANNAGMATGAWTRPDLAALAISRGEYVPFQRADLHTFEVKTASGLDIRGAHEARAQRRFGHYAWLVFQAVGNADRKTEKYDVVLSSANSLGVGVITFQNPADPSLWFIDAWPTRSNVDDATADEFVRNGFSDASKRQIRQIHAAQKQNGMHDG